MDLSGDELRSLSTRSGGVQLAIVRLQQQVLMLEAEVEESEKTHELRYRPLPFFGVVKSWGFVA